MYMNSMRAGTIVFLILSSLTVLSVEGFSQTSTKEAERVKNAAERSRKATEVLRLVADLPDGKGIPKEISEKMTLIGVIPDAFQLSLLVSKGVRGYGLSSLKQEGSWSMPSFYFFGKANGLDLTTIGTKRFDLIMVVVDLVIKKEIDPATGKKVKQEKSKSYIYSFADGVLKPVPARGGFVSVLLGGQTNIVYDDKLNKAVYGVKGNDVMRGNVDPAKPTIPETADFRDLLQQLFPK
jgi:hypothetical protein